MRTQSVPKLVENAPILVSTKLDISPTRVPLSTVLGSAARIFQSGIHFVQEAMDHSNDAEKHAIAVGLLWTPLAHVTTLKTALSLSLVLVSESAHGLLSQHKLASSNFSAPQTIQFFTFARRHAESVSIPALTIRRFRLRTMASTEIVCGCRQDLRYGLTHAPTQRYETPVARRATLVHRTGYGAYTSVLFARTR